MRDWWRDNRQIVLVSAFMLAVIAGFVWLVEGDASRRKRQALACHEQRGTLMYDRTLGAVCATQFTVLP